MSRHPAAGLILAAVVAAACGSSSSGSSPGGSVPTTSPPTSSAGQSTTSSSESACPTASLAITYDPAHSSGGAAGSLGLTYQLTNTSTVSCRLQGYPGLQLLAAGGQSLATEVSPRPATPAAVALAPGGHAWFAIEFPTQTGYGNLTCPRSTYLAVTPPGDSKPLRVAGQGGEIAAYGGTTQALRCGQIETTAVLAAPPA